MHEPRVNAVQQGEWRACIPQVLSHRSPSSSSSPPTARIAIGGPAASGIPRPRGGHAAAAGPSTVHAGVDAGLLDVSVDLGLDAETAAQLRAVAAAKAAAVAAEDFIAAKALKGVQDAIRSVGGTLAVLMADKAKAVRVSRR